MNFTISNTFTNELPADVNLENSRRQVFNACFSYVTPKQTAKPSLIHVSEEFSNEIGLTKEELSSEEFLAVFSGNKVLENTHPYAMCYGGYQFGNWAGQLGDGRAINLFEIDHNNKHWSLQLKGAGETPYSRRADGLAVLRSSIREHLCSEAMYHLGVPTTRSLSLSLTGDRVLRDVMYNGNAAYEKGAVVCRVAPSFIRFGNFEIFASRQDHETLKQLTDYTISHFYPEIISTGKQKYIDFLIEVRNRTIEMIVHWQRVGFVHGVMNTDNMSILGLTIDYGPYGWLEGFDYEWTPNTTDAQHRRYRFGNQGYIGMWNLYKLANALYPLVEDVDALQTILDAYESLYVTQYDLMMKKKLGLPIENDYSSLIADLEKTLQLAETDYTIFFRKLASVSKNDTSSSAFITVSDAFYALDELQKSSKEQWITWFDRYINILQKVNQSDQERAQYMNTVNPKYVLRNYMAQLAIDEADKGSYELIDELYQLLKFPYDEQPQQEKWFAKRPEWARHKIGCSMLSCSS
ncbi:protein adenylyltransferase SelO [Tenacibaculum agarivorans]|uniref:protein adenylyltransferase SelO n=1 Tax=Tenacibaculum agarivorans TaxID=1908389 RepID=UPI00094BA861|nr:YdiU family protein [Tenacibaculum agarivorans]